MEILQEWRIRVARLNEHGRWNRIGFDVDGTEHQRWLLVQVSAARDDGAILAGHANITPRNNGDRIARAPEDAGLGHAGPGGQRDRL